MLLTSVIHILGSLSLSIDKKAIQLGVGTMTVTPERPLFNRSRDGLTAFSRTGGNENEEESADSVRDATHVKGTVHMAATLKLGDLEAILREIPQVTTGIPFILRKGQVFAGAKSSTCQLFGITADFPLTRGYMVEVGRFFTGNEERTGQLVCVLGNALAARLFDNPDSAVGEYLRLEFSRTRILGVFPPIGADSSGTNMDEMIFLPLKTLMNRLSFRDHVDGFFLQTTTVEGTGGLPGLAGLLRMRHRLQDGGSDDFSISTAGKVDDMMANAFELLATLGGIGACISFTIGALGIFSVLTLLVHLRRVEIGIRRAVGTPAHVIMQQFLSEAGLIAGTGGVLGVLVGLLLIFGLSSLGYVQSYYNLPLSVAVALISLLFGLLAGGYPAWKASRTDILAVLRSNQ
jgi:putative ABC transport system permease protein